jgi:hypothetical protein
MSELNIITLEVPSIGNKCRRCYENIFDTCWASDGYTSCPICNKSCRCCSSNYNPYWLHLDKPRLEHEFIKHHKNEYCANCNILYRVGPPHADPKCCSDSYNFGLLCTSYKIGDDEYEGMPQFNSYEDYIKMRHNMSFNFTCPVPYFHCEHDSEADSSDGESEYYNNSDGHYDGYYKN